MPNKIITDAIELHNKQAKLFRDRYINFIKDPYLSTFTYGRKKVNEIISGYLSELPPPKNVLDVGCGTGFTLNVLKNIGYECVGVDGAEDMVKIARKENPDIPIYHADALNLPLKDNTFDIVISIELLRYIKDNKKAIYEMYRVLKKGGVCITTVAPLLSTHGYAIFNCINSKLHIPNFSSVKQYFETTNSIAKKFREVGFNDIEVKGCFIGPFLWFGKILPRKLFALILKAYEPIDNFMSNISFLRNFSNHLIVIARKGKTTGSDPGM